MSFSQNACSQILSDRQNACSQILSDPRFGHNTCSQIFSDPRNACSQIPSDPRFREVPGSEMTSQLEHSVYDRNIRTSHVRIGGGRQSGPRTPHFPFKEVLGTNCRTAIRLRGLVPGYGQCQRHRTVRFGGGRQHGVHNPVRSSSGGARTMLDPGVHKFRGTLSS